MPRPPDLSVRARIALAIFSLSFGILVAGSFAVYHLMAQSLETVYDQALEEQAAANRTLVTIVDGLPRLAAVADPDGLRSTGEFALRLYGRDGALLQDASPATGSSPREQSLVSAAVTSGAPATAILALGHEEPYGVIAEPLLQSGEVAGVLVTGLERDRVTIPLEKLLFTLIALAPATAALLGIGALAIARRALAPVATMAETASRIADGASEQRIPQPARQDELGELAQVLNLMIGRLSDATRRERQFTANAAHELRTPLAAMSAALDVTLSQDRAPERYRDTLESARSQTRRLSRLVDQLLLLARLDHDAAEIRARFGIIDLGALVGETAGDAARRFSNVSWRITLPAQPVLVDGDESLLASAIRNVLDNGALHAGANPAVTVGLRATEGGIAAITVEDDGPGIPPTMADAMYDRFRRADSGTAGSGLGLAITADIAHLHGGDITCLPQQAAAGGRFAITLPLVSDALPATPDSP